MNRCFSRDRPLSSIKTSSGCHRRSVEMDRERLASRVKTHCSAEEIAKEMVEPWPTQSGQRKLGILEIGRVLPGKRNRWRKLAQNHRPLLNQSVALLGIEFFEELLAGHGDFESPLWRVLEQCRMAPPWTARACDCGSGRPFRDCCLERANDLADQEIGQP